MEYEIWINGTRMYKRLQTGDFLFEEDQLILLLEGGTEEVLLEKGDRVEVRCE